MLLALLGAGAERHARDRAFRTPLDWARRRLALDADVPPGNWAADLADGLAAPVLQFDPAVDDARQLASIGDEKGVVALLLQGVSLNGVDNGSTHGATISLRPAPRENYLLSSGCWPIPISTSIWATAAASRR